jgi:hypothetical protein
MPFSKQPMTVLVECRHCKRPVRYDGSAILSAGQLPFLMAHLCPFCGQKGATVTFRPYVEATDKSIPMLVFDARAATELSDEAVQERDPE